MELVLTITAGLGVLLFLTGYLAFVLAGFRHHFVTGLISVLPVLNIVTVPSLWHKTSKKLMISVLGIAIFAASWFFGADANIKRLLFNSGVGKNNQVSARQQGGNQHATLAAPSISVNQTVKQIVGTTVIRPSNDDEEEAAMPFANIQRLVNDNELQALPARALYRLSFEEVPVDKLKTLKNRIVQLVTNKNELLEGRISRVSENSIFLQSGGEISVENEFPVANIKHLRLMIKKAVVK